jgi:hypothetical protein
MGSRGGAGPEKSGDPLLLLILFFIRLLFLIRISFLLLLCFLTSGL